MAHSEGWTLTRWRATASPSHRAIEVSGLMLANVLQAAGPSVAVLLLGHLHGLSSAGEFAYALAITAPLGQLFSFQLKALLLTHSPAEFPLSQALGLRLWLLPPLLLAAALLGAFTQPMVGLWLLARLLDSWAEVFQAEHQRSARLGRLAAGSLARTLALTIAVALIPQAWAAALLYLLLALLTLLWLDASPYPFAPRRAWQNDQLWLRRGFALGICLFLQAASSSFPRLLLESSADAASLGLFASLCIPLQTGNILASAYGQSLLPRLGAASLRQLVGWTLVPAACAGLALIVGWPLRNWFFVLLAAPVAPATDRIWLTLLCAQFAVWPAVFIGHALTARRLFRPQLWVTGGLLATSLLAGLWFVPRFGAMGAAMTLSATSLSMLAQSFFLLYQTEEAS
jgi:O-antigen/teichoic acid export membrane protein